MKSYEIYHLKTAFFVKIKCESNINSSKISDFNYFLYSRYKKALYCTNSLKSLFFINKYKITPIYINKT